MTMRIEAIETPIRRQKTTPLTSIVSDTNIKTMSRASHGETRRYTPHTAGAVTYLQDGKYACAHTPDAPWPLCSTGSGELI